MKAKKHIIITKLFEFSGSNSHLKALVKCWGEENIVLVLEDDKQLSFLKNIGFTGNLIVKVHKHLYGYAHLQYRLTTNLKELFLLIWSIFRIQLLSAKHGFADVTISAVEPEKHLYLFWMPFSKLVYILHTAPNNCYTSFTPYTCNRRLNNRRRLLTVSNSNRNLICEKWNIVDKKQEFVQVVYNCIIENGSTDRCDSSRQTGGQLVVTLGHVVAYKNPFVWLQVAQLVTSARKDVSFMWLGNGPLCNELKKATENTPEIAFPGAVEDPYTYLAKGTVYYQPSLHETHGIAVVEAMYHCLPCVVSNTGGLPESIEDRFNGRLVDPNDVRAHVDAILALLENSELRKQYGRNAFEKCIGLFSFKSFQDKMNAIYSS